MPGRAVPKGVTRGSAIPTRRSGKSDNPEITLVQRDIDAAFRGLNDGTPFKNGKLFTLSFSIGSLVQTIPHSLGGQYSGAWVVRNDAFQQVRDELPADDKQATTHVKLTASGPCEVKLWVWR